MKRIAVVYGTRPEAIKVAPLIRSLGDSDVLEPLIVVTGQHREMLDQVNDLFGIRPEHDLDLMVPGASLAEISSRALTGVSRVLQAERPDALVVQGDTSTAFIAALAAFYQHIPVVHLEAGLRTGNLLSPFPEEANRVLASRIATLHLAPTQVSRHNLLSEGIADDVISVIGNTVIDALYDALRVPTTFDDPALAALVASGERFVLVTAHRRESWGEPMRSAMQALADSATAHPDVRWVVPMHRNPIVREVIEGVLANVPTVLLTEPLEYHQFTHAMRAAHLMLTDSGGVQEEAPSLGKPVLVMRDTTERPEAVDAGTVRLVGTSRPVVSAALNELLDDRTAYNRMAGAVNPYGDGRAAPRARAAIEHMLGLGDRLPDFAPTSKGTVNV
jgi:UDP-N-acetylglucosamine 2-epimerase (non-hydrolysing)